MKTGGKGIGLLLMAKPKDDKAAADAGGGDLEAAAQEVLDAVKAGDASALADALRSAFRICDAEPHAEVEREAEED